ncbi:MAG: YifB family Mg chelatase-like AAA ATPase [Coriobacteriales bacterium]|nr:YifB family Mg chelatase-like AAA ATPase [Coriobacteriales bacterium]
MRRLGPAAPEGVMLEDLDGYIEYSAAGAGGNYAGSFSSYGSNGGYGAGGEQSYIPVGRMGFVKTATIQGVEAIPVTVEVCVSRGMPGINIVGMPDTAIQEAKLRVRQALKASGYEMSNRYVVVNLAPSSLKKIGSGFDLPIAIAYLLATEQIPADVARDRLCVGELSLDGTVKPALGQLAYEKLAHEQGWGLMTGPTIAGVFFEDDQPHVCLNRLEDLRSQQFCAPLQSDTDQATAMADFSDIAGNDLVKRALQIAAAGGHGLLMIGPPGSGKSMLASRLPSILPPLLREERIDSAMIHSVAGLPFERILAGERPFRAPHHGASRAGLIGGGTPTGPGEVSLAHNGVLFLDELPEFGTATLQLLRQPMEQGSVSLARAGGTVTFPARFMLVAAANPCPCGFYGDNRKSCKCTPQQVSRYMGRIGGPLMDRINIIVDVRRSEAAKVLATGTGTSSAVLRAGVMQAREFAAWRQQSVAPSLPALSAAAESAVALRSGSGAALLASCCLNDADITYLELLSERYQLSGRGIMSALTVGRTIADLETSEKVTQEHLLEAVSFRTSGYDG